VTGVIERPPSRSTAASSIASEFSLLANGSVTVPQYAVTLPAARSMSVRTGVDTSDGCLTRSTPIE
jgi:hypothetical protein